MILDIMLGVNARATSNPRSTVISLLAIAVLMVGTLLVLAPAAWAMPNSSPDETWVTDGSVFATAHVGNRVYLGGSFTQVGPNVGFGTALNSTDGQRDTAFPKVNGRIMAAAPDGNGGWYLGGDFTKVGSSFRLRLAHVLATGKVDSWAPSVEPSQVNALAVSGGKVYVGGAFTSVGGLTRNRLAAVDATTGAVDPNWNPDANEAVNTLAISGGKVYVGGAFNTIGGVARNRLATVDATTGAIDPNWNPNANGTVNVLTISPDGTRVYTGGTFTSVGGGTRNNVAALNTSAGTADAAWNPNANGAVNALAISGGKIYAGGLFTSVGGLTRNRVAAVDATTGTVDPNWNPNANFSVRALAPSADGSRIFLGGDLTDLNGTLRSRLAAVDATTGAVDKTFNAGTVDATVRALAVVGNRVYFGGDFTTVKGQSRTRLAAVDATTGALDTKWAPTADAAVRVLRLSRDGDRVYAGGAFSTIFGQARSYLAALNPVTGTLDGTFSPPKPNGTVFAIGESGGRVFVAAGGAGGTVEAFDTSTGTRVWSKSGDGDVQALLVRGDRVYAGGHFDTMGSQSRRRLVALDMATGAVDTQWVPEIVPRTDGSGLPDSGVWTMAGTAGPRMYIGGDFQKITRLVQSGYAQFSDADTTAPTVSATTPVDGASGFALAANTEAVFSEAMNETSLSGTTFTLTKQGAGASVAAAVTYDPMTKKATLDPNSDLEPNATYTATIKGGAGGTRDVAGNALATDKIWSFSTIDTLPPDTSIQSGPSGTVSSTLATFQFSSSEPNSTFECSLDGAPFGSCTSPKDLTNLSNGSHTFEVRATDAAGNVDATPASRSWTIDATPPTVTSVAPQDGATDVALDARAEATFSEDMDPSTIDASTFTLTNEGTGSPVAATVAYDAAARKATLTPTTQLETGSTYTARVRGGASGAKDVAGNALSADEVWTFFTAAPADTTPPGAPTNLDLVASSDSGVSDSDDVTNDDTPTVSGKAEAGSHVELYDGTNLVGSATADSDGDWSITSSVLGEGRHTLTAAATDAAGNTSTASVALVVTIDKSAPIVRDEGPKTPPNGDNEWYKSAVANQFSATDNVGLANPDQALFQMSSGTNEGDSVRISSGAVSDVAGNTNPGIDSGAFRIDMTSPVISGQNIDNNAWRNSDLTADFTASDSGSGLASQADASFTLTASEESTKDTDGNVVPTRVSRTVTDMAGNSATRDVSALIDRHAPVVIDEGATFAPDGDNGWYVSPVSNRFSASDGLSGFAGQPDPHNFTNSSGADEGPAVRINSGPVVDRAGNSAPSVESVGFKIDLTAPAAPTRLDLLASSDTGASDTDNVTTDDTPTFSVEAEPGSIVRVYKDTDPTALGLATADASGSATVTSSPLADGTYAISATATDAAGNVSGSSNTINVTIGITVDTVPPTVSGVAPQDGATGVATDANAEAAFSEDMDPSTINATSFTLTKQGATAPVAATVGYDAAARKATLAPGAPLDPGATYTATIKGGANGVRDLAGNALSVDKVWTFQTAIPADTTPPTVTIDSKPASLTNNASPSFGFSSNENGSTFKCSLTRGTDPDDFAACDSPKGYGPLSDGNYTFKVKATDAAGNTSDPATYGFEVDATAPTVTIDSGPTGTVTTDAATFAFSSNEAGSTFECSLDGASFGSCASPKNYTSLADGSHTFGVKAIDRAGNISQAASRTWTVDAVSTLMAAGNIACNATVTRTDICQEKATSDTLVANSPDAVLPLGDNQYECGYLKDYNKYYERSWGRMKAITRPILGNHEYSTSTDTKDPCYNAPSGAPGYFQYFGNAATPLQPGCTVNCKGYYSYDLGSWHIIALNSICTQVGGCGKGSPQEVWLKNDLAAHPNQCTLAYWHYPRFSSSESGTTYTSYLATLWQDLYDAKADVVLNAHDHVYERFAPMDTAGTIDRANGMREFIVGTGGKKHMSFVNVLPSSEVRNGTTYGSVKMTLRPNGYDWTFLPVAGATFTDSGSDSCH